MKMFAKFLLFFVVFPVSSFSQSNAIDTVFLNHLSTTVDSLQQNCKTTKEYIILKRGHTSYDLSIRYVIDSLSDSLFTCGYFEEFNRGDPYYYVKRTIFYFNNGRPYLAKISTILNEKESVENKIYFSYKDSAVVSFISLAYNKDWDIERINKSIWELNRGYESLLSYLRNR